MKISNIWYWLTDIDLHETGIWDKAQNLFRGMLLVVIIGIGLWLSVVLFCKVTGIKIFTDNQERTHIILPASNLE